MNLYELQTMVSTATGAASGSRHEAAARHATTLALRAWNPVTMAACARQKKDKRKTWEEIERKRLKSVVMAEMRKEYPVKLFDPFSWLTIISIVISVIKIIMDYWNKNTAAQDAICSVRTSMGLGE